MTYSKMILYLLTSTIVSDKIQSKSKDLFKNLNNFKNVLYFIIDNVTTSNVINLNIIKSGFPC